MCIRDSDSPDHTGHTEGHDTPAYYEKLKELDTYVGQIVQAVKDAGILMTLFSY